MYKVICHLISIKKLEKYGKSSRDVELMYKVDFSFNHLDIMPVIIAGSSVSGRK